ncbi:uncharacterized protein MONOS_17445 [Monocercomonoides exilis]|uniref:uncharacterized protein n=1 Tax=Monocercomonoides exilis TaxID=2049356 RepID=UPI00355A725F|nr:hypothetical protein MONOS_17445 [Monocercomonoides exilis]
MKERNILEACAKVDEKENVYRSLEEETKEQFKLAAELEQERKEHEQLMESLSELRKNYDTFIEDLVTATQVVKT